jgi:hypothetical protein
MKANGTLPENISRAGKFKLRDILHIRPSSRALNEMDLFEMSCYCIWLYRIATSCAYHNLISGQIPKQLFWFLISDKLRFRARHGDRVC